MGERDQIDSGSRLSRRNDNGLLRMRMTIGCRAIGTENEGIDSGFRLSRRNDNGLILMRIAIDCQAIGMKTRESTLDSGCRAGMTRSITKANDNCLSIDNDRERGNRPRSGCRAGMTMSIIDANDNCLSDDKEGVRGNRLWIPAIAPE